MIKSATRATSHPKMFATETKWYDDDSSTNLLSLLHINDIICYKNKCEMDLRLGLVLDCFQEKIHCKPMKVDENDFKFIKMKTNKDHDAYELVSNDQIIAVMATGESRMKGKGDKSELQCELLEFPWTAIEARMSMPFETQEEEENVFEDKIHQSWRLKDDKLLYSLYKNGASLDYLMKRLERGRQGVLRRIQHIEDPSHNAHFRFFGTSGDNQLIPNKTTNDKYNNNNNDAETRQTLDKIQKIKPLKPIKEVKIRLIYGEGSSLSDFSFGYMDRFDGIIECPADSSNLNVKGKERLLLKAIPEHRIEYVKYKERIVWHKQERLDLVFGSGPNELSNCKLDKVIEEYDLWWEREQGRRKLLEEEELSQAKCGYDDNIHSHRNIDRDSSSSDSDNEIDNSDLYDDSLLIDDDEFMQGF